MNRIPKGVRSASRASEIPNRPIFVVLSVIWVEEGLLVVWKGKQCVPKVGSRQVLGISGALVQAPADGTSLTTGPKVTMMKRCPNNSSSTDC